MRFLLGVFLIIGLIAGAVQADSSPSASKAPQAGQTLPLFNLPVPADPEHQAYLGLPTTGEFNIGNIKAELVIIEIFSMY